MTPIELALAKAMGAIMSEAGDIAVDKAKDGLAGMLGLGKSSKQQKADKLYKGFLADSEKKETAKLNSEKYKKEEKYHRKKMGDIDKYIGLTDISERFNNMVNSMNSKMSHKGMRMVANRIKKRRKRKGKKK